MSFNFCTFLISQEIFTQFSLKRNHFIQIHNINILIEINVQHGHILLKSNEEFPGHLHIFRLKKISIIMKKY